MSVILGLVFGVLGALSLEVLDLYRAMAQGLHLWRRIGGRAYFLAAAVRVAVGAGLAASMVAGDQIRGHFAAFIMGLVGPVLVEKLAAPLTTSPPRRGTSTD